MATQKGAIAQLAAQGFVPGADMMDATDPEKAASVAAVAAAAAAAVAASGPGAAERVLTNLMMAVTANGSGGDPSLAMSPAEARQISEQALATLAASPAAVNVGGGGGLVPKVIPDGMRNLVPGGPDVAGTQWLASSPLLQAARSGIPVKENNALVPATTQITGMAMARRLLSKFVEITN